MSNDSDTDEPISADDLRFIADEHGDDRIVCDDLLLRAAFTIDQLRAELDAMHKERDSAYAQIGRTQNRIAEAEAIVCQLVKSARPHPTEHPTMWAAWQRAEDYLRLPDSERRTDRARDGAGAKECVSCGYAPCMCDQQ